MVTPRRAIVTGADGFVGSGVVGELLAHGWEVVAVDLAPVPSRLSPAPGLAYVACDASDAEGFAAAMPDGPCGALFHLAWAGSAGPRRADCALQMANAVASAELVRAAARLGVRRFVGAGSIMEREVEYAVGEQGSRPGMGYVYGTGKLAAHCLCKSVAADSGIELLWPMITNAYGAGELSPRFVNTTLRKADAGEALSFTAATQRYDFVYVTDVARAFRLVAERGLAFSEYVIGSGDARPLRELVAEMLAAVAPQAVPRFGDVPFTGTDMPPEAFDTSDLERDCGWQPEVSLAEGARMTMAWLRSRGGGVARRLARRRSRRQAALPCDRPLLGAAS